MTQAASQTRIRSKTFRLWILAILPVVAIGLAATFFHQHWLPQFRGWLFMAISATATKSEPVDEHAGHDHGSKTEVHSIKLSESARKNIGLQLGKVALKSFTRSISVPGIVVERPGRSTVQVTAPLTGIITKIYPTEGEAVAAGTKLFDIRLTHEELVQSQADLLRTTEELDVIGLEIERIEKLTKDGGLAGKTLLERKYEQQKQQAALRSQRQALLLHGLSAAQVDAIVQQRQLLNSLAVAAPAPTDRMSTSDNQRYFQVRELKIAQGQHVNAGDTLALLVDHTELFIEGNAFERDVPEINRVSAADKLLSAMMENDSRQAHAIDNLKILYVAPQIEPDSRTLHFYVTLPNQMEQNKLLEDGRRYISWRFRPGQRAQLQIPVETWSDRIVLPVDAVVEDGPEAYVFSPNGDQFERRAIHVEYKDQTSVVVANDGVLFPGDLVAMSAAKQLQLALKNKAGGGIDPHAGHNH